MKNIEDNMVFISLPLNMPRQVLWMGQSAAGEGAAMLIGWGVVQGKNCI